MDFSFLSLFLSSLAVAGGVLTAALGYLVIIAFLGD